MSTVILLATLLAQTNPGAGATGPDNRTPAGAQSPAIPAKADTQPATSAASLPVLTLEQALTEARKANLDLKVTEARLSQANEISAKVWAGYLPQITASGAYTRNEVKQEFDTGLLVQQIGNAVLQSMNPGAPPIAKPDVAPTVLQPLNQVTGQVQVSQGIILPQLWAGISSAYAGQRAAKLTIENANREIMFGVVQLYYGAVGAKQGLEAQQRLLNSSLAHERDARTRVEAGAQPRIALIRAQIDRARAEQDVKRAEASLASLKISLATMLQHREEFDVAEPAEPPVNPDAKTLESAALRDRPDVQAARANLDMAESGKTQTWLAYLPNVVASASYRYANFTGFSDKKTTWLATLGAQWTLFDGGLREANLREASAKLLEAQANASNAEARAIDDVRKGLLDLESARANARKAQEQLNLARENMRLVDVNFNSGVATQLEVTDAQTALANAEIGAIGERLNAQLAAVRLLKAAGSFNP